MKLEDVIRRADELIQFGQANLKSARPDVGEFTTVDTSKFAEFRSASLSFIGRVFGSSSPHYEEFRNKVRDQSTFYTEAGIGILRACRGEIAGGWLFETRSLVSAELFSDFVQMAEHLLSENYKDPAAVIIGSVLEEHLRQLCQRNSIAVESIKPDGSTISLKAEALNTELARAGVYGKLDQKNVTAWLDLRNKAAHGKYAQYTEGQVSLMLEAVSDFIARVPS